MKILFITDQLYKSGGIERVLTLKANYMHRVFGWDISILTSEQKQLEPYFELDPDIRLIDLGITYNRERSYFSLGNLKKVPQHLIKQRNTIKILQPDFVISVSFGPDFYWLPFICKNTRKIKEFHSSRYYDFKNYQRNNPQARFKWRFRAFIEKQYNSLIVLNQSEWQFYNNKNIQVIPNPAPEPSFNPSKLENKKVVAAGRIAPVKGFDKLIEAWKLVVEQHPDWVLDIYGDDYLGTTTKLKKLIHSYGLEKVINIKESCPNILEEMRNYSLYLMTSKTECFPMVLLEAMSIGLPVISFDCPTGPRHILIEKQADLLVDDQNIQEFAYQICRLITNKSLRSTYGMKAKAISGKFAIQEIMSMWNKELISRKN